jgi:opacity protein-like surface antigen
VIVSKRNSLRLAAVAALSALLLGTAGTAMAAAPAAPVASSASAAHAAITAKPSVSSVQAWQLFRVTGTTTGLKAGSTVTLQQKQHGTWVTLPASVHTTHNGSYSLGVKLGIKGLNELRIISGNTASPVFTVTVR